MAHFSHNGLLRLSQIIGPDGPIPVSRSFFWANVKSGRFPQPIKLGPRITAWRVEDIERLIADGVSAPRSCNAKTAGIK